MFILVTLFPLRYFFRCSSVLRQELRKCKEFFASVEAQFLVRRARVREGWRQLLLPDMIVEGDPHKRLMAACVKLYKDLLLLENFAIMNYTAFSKILKKHDKLTG
jgi:SPX domain protein involved in polyphosphate accumulation